MTTIHDGRRFHPGTLPGQYSSQQVCDVTGLSYRQLDHMMSVHYGRNVGTGRSRSYTLPDVLRVAATAELIGLGLSSQCAWEMVRHGSPTRRRSPLRLEFHWSLLVWRVVQELRDLR